MATVQELVKASLRAIGAIATGETPTAAEMADALEAFQLLLAEWSGAGMVVPCVTYDQITLIIGQLSYSIGEDGADVDTLRPEQILHAFVRSAGYDYPVTIIGERSYQSLSNKSTSGRPDKLWYNACAPNGIVSLYPNPDALDEVWISSVKPFIELTSLTEDLLGTIKIPVNYHAPLKWNLALELYPEYPKPGLDLQVIIRRAQQGYDRLVSLNAARQVQPAVIEIVTGSDYDNNDLLDTWT